MTRKNEKSSRKPLEKIFINFRDMHIKDEAPPCGRAHPPINQKPKL
jgi:hypothetical protein